MSQENVKIALRFERAIDAHDVPADLLAADFVWCPATMGAVEGTSYRGPEGLAAYYRGVGDTWEEMRLVVEEARDLDEHVLVLGRMRVRGRGSGVPVETPMASIHDLRDGKISRVRVFFDLDEAFKAVGLAE